MIDKLIDRMATPLVILALIVILAFVTGVVEAHPIEDAEPIPQILYCSQTLDICVDFSEKGVYEGAPPGTVWIGGYEYLYPAECRPGALCKPMDLFEDGSVRWDEGNDCLIPDWGCTVDPDRESSTRGYDNWENRG